MSRDDWKSFERVFGNNWPQATPFPNLQKLDISYGAPSSHPLDILMPMIRSPLLTDFTIMLNLEKPCAEEEIAKLVEILHGVPLQRLRLYDAVNTDVVQERLYPLIRQQPTLISLSMPRGEPGMIQVATELADLTELGFDWAGTAGRWTPPDDKAFRNLQALRLQGDDEELTSFISLLPTQSLRSLHLDSSISLPNGRPEDFIKAVSGFRDLTTLNLSMYTNVFTLFQPLYSLSRLQHLTLQSSLIFHVRKSDLLDIAKSFPEIQSLMLGDNNVKDAQLELQDLECLSTHCPRLSRLEICVRASAAGIATGSRQPSPAMMEVTLYWSELTEADEECVAEYIVQVWPNLRRSFPVMARSWGIGHCSNRVWNMVAKKLGWSTRFRY